MTTSHSPPAKPIAARVSLAAPPWHCDPNFIVCRDDHLLTLYKTGYRGDLRRLSGHAFFECRECSPAPTYFLAVFAKVDGMASVTCYEIARDSYLEWDKTEEPTPPTPELLYRLFDPAGRSLNPYWRPAR